MKRDEKFIRNWSKNREKGKGWYMITRGIILGISVEIGAMVGLMTKGNALHFDPTYFIGGFTGGVIGSRFGWNKNEARYNDLINNKK